MSDIECDVLVVGGGTAGFGAAIAAARAGMTTHVIEVGQKIGGVMASCPGMPWGAAYPADVHVGGIMQELSDRLMDLDPPAAEKRPCTLENFGPEIVYDHDIATLTMFEMLEEAGVTLHLGMAAQAVEMHNNRIVGLQASDRLGHHHFVPKTLIDCTGDGDISAKAGVPYALGDQSGNMMGVSLTFFMVGADWDRVFAGNDPYFQSYAAKGIAEGRLHPDLAKLYLMKAFHSGTVFCNSVVIRGVDGTDPQEVTRATQEGRRRCKQMADFLQSDVPGFEAARMIYLGPMVGVRETRKLEGQYRITGEDLARATKFDDGIVCCDNPIDDVMRDSAAMTHDAIVREGSYYTIPLRALLPKSVENLAFAGRIVSADPVAFASVRGMPQCMIMGQAAGLAAAQAVSRNTTMQSLDYALVVRALQNAGVQGLGNTQLGAGK